MILLLSMDCNEWKYVKHLFKKSLFDNQRAFLGVVFAFIHRNKLLSHLLSYHMTLL